LSCDATCYKHTHTHTHTHTHSTDYYRNIRADSVRSVNCLSLLQQSTELMCWSAALWVCRMAAGRERYSAERVRWSCGWVLQGGTDCSEVVMGWYRVERTVVMWWGGTGWNWL
jgi:hypothetical protein